MKTLITNLPLPYYVFNIHIFVFTNQRRNILNFFAAYKWKIERKVLTWGKYKRFLPGVSNWRFSICFLDEKSSNGWKVIFNKKVWSQIQDGLQSFISNKASWTFSKGRSIYDLQASPKTQTRCFRYERFCLFFLKVPLSGHFLCLVFALV